MSIKIEGTKENVARSKSVLREDLTFSTQNFLGKRETSRAFIIQADQSSMRIPLLHWRKFFDEFPQQISARSFHQANPTLDFQLYTKETDKDHIRDQDVVVAEALTKLLDTRCCLLNLSTAFGKTKIAIHLIAQLKYRTLWICSIADVRKSAYNEICSSTNLKCKLMTGSLDINDARYDDVDVFFCGPLMCKNLDYDFFQSIGTVVVDECHTLPDATYLRHGVLLKVQPHYLLGLSATPDIADECTKIYFGNEHVVRFMRKEFTIHKINTSFTVNPEFMMIGGRNRVDYTNLCNQLAGKKDRQKAVAFMAENFYASERIIILTDRNEVAIDIFNYLENQEDAELYIGAMKIESLKGKRILIGERKKCGTGFDDQRITSQRYTCLFVVFDTKEIRQNEGRIRIQNNYVVDFVDDFYIFRNHWKKRESWYIERGAIIEEYNLIVSDEGKIELNVIR